MVRTDPSEWREKKILEEERGTHPVIPGGRRVWPHAQSMTAERTSEGNWRVTFHRRKLDMGWERIEGFEGVHELSVVISGRGELDLEPDGEVILTTSLDHIDWSMKALPGVGTALEVRLAPGR